MSDKSKAEKLAAARKLLKQFQQKMPSKPHEDAGIEYTDTKTELGGIDINNTLNLQKSQSDDFSNVNSTVPFLQEQFIPEDSAKTYNKTPNEICFQNITSNIEDISKLQSNENVPSNPFQNIFHQSQIEDGFYENFKTNQSTFNSDANGTFKSNESTEVQKEAQIEHCSDTAKPNSGSLEIDSFNTTLSNSNILGIDSNDDKDHSYSEILQNEFTNYANNVIGSVSLNKSHSESSHQNISDLLYQEKAKNENLYQENQRLCTARNDLHTELNILQKDADNIMKMKQDFQILQDQLQLHVKTVNVLVGEKNELITQINKYETAVDTHNAECEELQGRLRAARHKSLDLEKELGQTKIQYYQLEKDNKILQEQFEQTKNEHYMCNKQCDDMKEEVSELKENLKSMSNKCKHLENEISEKTNELSLNHLRIQQLSSGDSSNMDNNWDALVEEKKLFQSKLSEMELLLNKSKNETIQLTQQYKQYCQQLNSQMQNLMAGLQEKSEENDKLSARERELVNHVNELEKQLQSVPKVKISSIVDEIPKEKYFKDFELKYESLEKQCEELNCLLEQKTSELQSTMEELNECKSHINQLEESLETIEADKLDTAKLNAAIESDKVAAARSMAQNADLKLQIEELQRSFIQMSDYKLEITEKLNCEQHLGRELNSQVIKLEKELLKLRTVLEAKDEEMIRLQNENTNLTKEILQQSQLSDRLRHYEARDNVTDIVQKELQQARDQIASLVSRNNELENMVTNTITEVKIPNRYEEGYNVAKRLIRENSSESSDVMETIPENDTPVSMYESRNDVSKIGLETVPIIATNEAMEKLQERFTRTMADIAELTEEKQRLEHLVLQLQSETETVGEYIALYQNQRSLLKQRELEKDNQLLKLAHDQDDMKSKLMKLNQLVIKLLQEREQMGSTEHCQNAIEIAPNDAGNIEDLKTNEKESDELVNAELLNNLAQVSQTSMKSTMNSSDTAGKIIELLTELKSSDLIHPYHGELMENFAHHCHCCSGRLLTV